MNPQVKIEEIDGKYAITSWCFFSISSNFITMIYSAGLVWKIDVRRDFELWEDDDVDVRFYVDFTSSHQEVKSQHAPGSRWLTLKFISAVHDFWRAEDMKASFFKKNAMFISSYESIQTPWNKDTRIASSVPNIRWPYHVVTTRVRLTDFEGFSIIGNIWYRPKISISFVRSFHSPPA